jgi:hypothetical protein
MDRSGAVAGVSKEGGRVVTTVISALSLTSTQLQSEAEGALSAVKALIAEVKQQVSPSVLVAPKGRGSVGNTREPSFIIGVADAAIQFENEIGQTKIDPKNSLELAQLAVTAQSIIDPLDSLVSALTSIRRTALKLAGGDTRLLYKRLQLAAETDPEIAKVLAPLAKPAENASRKRRATLKKAAEEKNAEAAAAAPAPSATAAGTTTTTTTSR